MGKFFPDDVVGSDGRFCDGEFSRVAQEALVVLSYPKHRVWYSMQLLSSL